ncbi:unnamed protein product [Psylliodes chrysocephalus]|uniref:Uncharacterized protein n=1 Tax=Psylliodes chrysocephalus TaxID=3402493 RepID=A0A9P0GGA8_9CUCU|nr:unnamed protein product [Psylliodes chrysocephala]
MATSPVKYHYFHRFFTYSVRRDSCVVLSQAATLTVFSSQGYGVAFRCVVPCVGLGLAVSCRWDGRCMRAAFRASIYLQPDSIRGHSQAGSLTGAVHLSKNNAGVLRPAQRGQKPHVEQQGKSWLDPDV